MANKMIHTKIVYDLTCDCRVDEIGWSPDRIELANRVCPRLIRFLINSNVDQKNFSNRMAEIIGNSERYIQFVFSIPTSIASNTRLAANKAMSDVVASRRSECEISEGRGKIYCESADEAAQFAVSSITKGYNFYILLQNEKRDIEALFDLISNVDITNISRRISIDEKIIFIDNSNSQNCFDIYRFQR